MALAVCVAASACRLGEPEAEKGGRLERITVAPRDARRAVGQAQQFTATGHYAGGGTRNLTQRVEWSVSDPAIARAANAAGDRSRVEAMAPGSVTVTATDPKTTVSSHASAGDATFTVLGALERITLAPEAATRRVGQTQRLTATGHYAGGTTRNLTQHVVYSSSDESVAATPNDPKDKSRIDMVGTGTATITAIDPTTRVAARATVTVVTAKP